MAVSAEGSLSSHRDSFPARYPPPFNVDTYFRDYRSRFETLRFSALPSHGAGLVVPYGPDFHDAAAGA